MASLFFKKLWIIDWHLVLQGQIMNTRLMLFYKFSGYCLQNFLLIIFTLYFLVAFVITLTFLSPSLTLCTFFLPSCFLCTSFGAVLDWMIQYRMICAKKLHSKYAQVYLWQQSWLEKSQPCARARKMAAVMFVIQCGFHKWKQNFAESFCLWTKSFMNTSTVRQHIAVF